MYPLQAFTTCPHNIHVALYEMLLEEFFSDNPQLKQVCLIATEGVEAACSDGNKHTKIESADIVTVFQ